MSLWKIAWRSIGQRSLASILTGFSMALGVALVVVVLVAYGVLNAYFMQGAQGYDLIIGAKGSKQQLVFNTVFHLDQPIENIPYGYYQEFTTGVFAPWTKVAIPFCLGDSYHAAGQTFRVVGTTRNLFEQIEYGRNPDGTARRYALQAGRNFETRHFFEAVIGSVVAYETGLQVGDTFRPAHGIAEEPETAPTHDAFTIVGVLAATGTPNDRALFVNIEGFYLLEDHAKPRSNGHGTDADGAHGDGPRRLEDHTGTAAGAEDASSHQHEADRHSGAARDHEHASGAHFEPLPEEQREVTAVLVLVESPLLSQRIYTRVNKGRVAQAVYPVQEITKLFDTFLAPMQMILLVLTILIVAVAGVSILVSIYNSMSQRQHEIAVMRALGASRGTVMAVIILESILLSVTGGLAGLVLGHGVLCLVSPYVVARTGVALGFLQFSFMELTLIPGLVALAALVGLLPAMTAYRTDVAKSLDATR